MAIKLAGVGVARRRKLKKLTRNPTLGSRLPKLEVMLTWLAPAQNSRVLANSGSRDPIAMSQIE